MSGRRARPRPACSRESAPPPGAAPARHAQVSRAEEGGRLVPEPSRAHDPQRIFQTHSRNCPEKRHLRGRGWDLARVSVADPDPAGGTPTHTLTLHSGRPGWGHPRTLASVSGPTVLSLSKVRSSFVKRDGEALHLALRKL